MMGRRQISKSLSSQHSSDEIYKPTLPMCGLESGRALQRLEEFGGYPVLEKTSFHGITRFNLN
jgi:hypothetical protein